MGKTPFPPTNDCLGLDIKPYDDEAAVLKLYGM